MPPRFCCCNPDCVICSDNFNRENGTANAGNWEIIDYLDGGGDWEISGETLVCIDEGPIISSCRPEPSTRTNTEYSIKMWFKCIGITEGSSHKVICGYISSDTFYWVRLDESGGSLFPVFYYRSGGADTLLMDIGTHPEGIGFPYDAEDGSWLGKICFSEVDWTVDVGDASEDGVESGNGIEQQNSETQWTVTGTGGLASLPADPGLGMVGFLAGDFDNFSFHYHWEMNATCDYCSCICRNPDDIDDYSQLPECLLATFVPLFDPYDYDCILNTAYIELRQGTETVSGLSPRKYVWSSYDSGFNTPTSIEVFFYCLGSSVPDPVDRFRLCIKIPSFTGTYYFGSGATQFTVPCGDVSNIDCNPLSMDFGDLYADYSTCEISPGVQGIFNPLCQGGECLVENETNAAFLNGLRWKVVLTACP